MSGTSALGRSAPPVQRVVVVGVSCSGKTTLARALARALNAHHIELDAHYNLADWVAADRSAMRAEVSRELARQRWVVDGNYDWLQENVWPRADLVVFLDLSRIRVTARALVRTASRLVLRTGLWNGNRERWRHALSVDPRRSMPLWAWKRQPVYRQMYRAYDGVLRSGEAGPAMHRITSPQGARRFVRSLRSGR